MPKKIDLVEEEPMEQNARLMKELGLSPHSGTDSLLERIPLIGILRSMGKVSEEKDRFKNPELLAGESGPGNQLGTDFRRGTQPFDHEADVQMMSQGGIAGMDGMSKSDEAYEPVMETETAGTDSVEIPEDIREYVEQAHKARSESRPDEGWRVKPAEDRETVAPYKRDAEETASEDHGEGDSTSGMPHYDEGGEVGQPPDEPSFLDRLTNSPAAKIAGFAMDPLGSGLSAAAKAAPGILKPELGALKEAEGPMLGVPAAKPAPMAPVAPPVPPAPKVASAPPVAAPVVPPPAGPATPDSEFMARANKMMGLDPGQQAGLMKLLGGGAQKGQIGAALAGVGDAIASGGTLGKVNPGALGKSEDLINSRTQEGIEGMQTIRGNQEKSQELADKLEARDPKSQLSRYAQKAYAGVGKKIGLDLSNASAQLIGDVAGKTIEQLKNEAEVGLKEATLGIQKQQVTGSLANQKSEREEKALEDLSKMGFTGRMMHPGISKALEKQSGLGGEDRVTVVSPTGQIGHIPSEQLAAALKKGYKQQ